MWLWSRSQERFWCQLTYNSSGYLNWLLADFRVVAGIRIVTPMLHIHKLRTKGRYWINLWCLCQCHSHQLNLINDSVSPVLSYVTVSYSFKYFSLCTRKRETSFNGNLSAFAAVYRSRRYMCTRGRLVRVVQRAVWAHLAYVKHCHWAHEKLYTLCCTVACN